MTPNAQNPTEADWGRRLRQAEAPVDPALSRAFQARLSGGKAPARVVPFWQQPALRAAALWLLILAPVAGVLWWQTRTGATPGTEGTPIATTPTPTAPAHQGPAPALSPEAPDDAIASNDALDATPAQLPSQEQANQPVGVVKHRQATTSSQTRVRAAQSITQQALASETPAPSARWAEASAPQSIGDPQPAPAQAEALAQQISLPEPTQTAKAMAQAQPVQPVSVAPDAPVQPAVEAPASTVAATHPAHPALQPPLDDDDTPAPRRGIVSQIVNRATRLARTPRADLAHQLAYQRDQVLALTQRRPTVELTQDRLSVTY